MQFRKHAAVGRWRRQRQSSAHWRSYRPRPGAAGLAPVPIVQVRDTHNGIKVGANNTITAGRTIFHVTTGKGVHQVNIVKLKKGYTLPQFGQDIGKAFGRRRQGDQPRRPTHGAARRHRGGPEAPRRVLGEPAGRTRSTSSTSNTNKFACGEGRRSRQTPRQRRSDRRQDRALHLRIRRPTARRCRTTAGCTWSTTPTSRTSCSSSRSRRARPTPRSTATSRAARRASRRSGCGRTSAPA